MKNLPDPSKDFVQSNFQIYASEYDVDAPEGVRKLEVVQCPIDKQYIY